MYICVKCGTQLTDDVKFCTKCGNAVEQLTSDYVPINIPDVPRPLPKAKPIKKKRKIAIIAFTALLVVATALVLILIVTNPLNSFKNDVNSGNYEKAFVVFDERIEGDPDKESDAYKFLQNRIEEIQDAYIAGNMDYNSAIAELETIRSAGVLDGTLLDEVIAEINVLNDSRTAYQTAQGYIANSNYTGAIEQLQMVILADGNYANAQSQLKDITAKYKTDVLSKAEDAQNSKKFDDAINILQSALTILPDDPELTTQLLLTQTAKLQAHKEEEMSKAAELMGKGDYTQTFNILRNLLAEMPNDADIMNKLAEYQAAYADYISKQADELVAQQNYMDAISLVNTSLTVDPENTALLQLKEKLTIYIPVNICDLTKITSLGVLTDWGSPTDNFGNTYGSGLDSNFNPVYSEDNYAEYNLNGEYLRIKGVLIFSYSSYDTSTYNIKIYGDGILIGETESISVRKPAVYFEFDVSSVRLLRIEMYKTSGIGTGSYTDDWGLADTYLYKY